MTTALNVFGRGPVSCRGRDRRSPLVRSGPFAARTGDPTVVPNGGVLSQSTESERPRLRKLL